ncbi:MAG: hypothetical protein R3F17_03310 [Planctomycetota bacterium]
MIAAANADLQRAVEGRPSAWTSSCRLNVVPLRAPALREHAADIAELAAHLLGQMAERSGRRAPVLTQEAVEFLQTQPWPGNVRQLRNVLQAAVFADEGRPSRRGDLERVLEDNPGLTTPTAGVASGLQDLFDVPTFEDFKNLSEARFFEARLARNDDGNVKRTAEELGMQRSLYKSSTATGCAERGAACGWNFIRVPGHNRARHPNREAEPTSPAAAAPTPRARPVPCPHGAGPSPSGIRCKGRGMP